jgi:diaminopimelate decarboxylase
MDGCDLLQVAAEHPTPFYLYSERALETRLRRLHQSFAKVGLSAEIHYSVKANPLLGILKVVHTQGHGFDVVSLGEAQRCLQIGAPASKMVFSGSGKALSELEFAIANQIRMINVESESELRDVIEVAQRLGKRAPVSLRINPNVDALTHEYITTGTHDTKFGISINRALHLYYKYQSEPALNWVGLDMHIGSQLTEIEPIEKALKIYVGIVKELATMGFQLQYLDIGGGLGIAYSTENVITAEKFAELVHAAFKGVPLKGAKILVEPGRFVVAPAGVLISQVLHIKSQALKKFLILDAGMGELIRPALYQAHHRILPLQNPASLEQEIYTVAGPICESTDVFAEDRSLPKLAKGDFVALCDAGAYGVSMESSYNSRPRCAQILLQKDGKLKVIREREPLADLWRLENP